MDIITYQNINQILGDEKKRFFSYGFKLARHHFKNVEYDWTNGEENSACKIVYSGVWSQKEHTTEPHLTTLDGLLIALYMSENFIRKLFGLSEKELEHAWICELHMKSGANAVYKLNKISVHCQYKGTKKTKSNSHYKSLFKTQVDNMKIELTIYHPVNVFRLHFDDPKIDQKNITYCYDQILKCSNHNVGLTIVDLKSLKIFSKIKILFNDTMLSETYHGLSASHFPCYTLVDIFVCASQQMQSLLYQLDSIDRGISNNLWMREIYLKYEPPYKNPSSFYQIATIENMKLLNLRGQHWRTSTITVRLPNIDDFELKVKLAHQLPSNYKKVGNQNAE